MRYERFFAIASRSDKLIGLNSSSDVSLKGNPVVPGDQLASKPTWLNSSVWFGHIGFVSP